MRLTMSKPATAIIPQKGRRLDPEERKKPIAPQMRNRMPITGRLGGTRNPTAIAMIVTKNAIAAEFVHIRFNIEAISSTCFLLSFDVVIGRTPFFHRPLYPLLKRTIKVLSTAWLAYASIAFFRVHSARAFITPKGFGRNGLNPAKREFELWYNPQSKVKRHAGVAKW